MPSETDLLNDALSQIGASRITAIDDGSVNANWCQTLYPSLRDGVLRSHHWNFAISRAQLAQDTTAPLYEYAFSYTLPADCLKVIRYAGGNPDTSTVIVWDDTSRTVPSFKIEGRKLFTNDGQVLITYISRVVNPDVWDALFYQVIATWLASKLANAIPKDVKMSAGLLEQAVRVLLPAALAADGQEGSTDAFISDALIWGR